MTTLARMVLAGVFAYSGVVKAIDPVQSVMAVRGYEILPGVAAKAVGYGLPFLELALAALLVAGVSVRLTTVASAALVLVFIVAVTQAWARNLTIDCGCFGGGGAAAAGQTKYLGTILRDVGLIALAGWAIVFSPGRFAVDSLLTGQTATGSEEETSAGGARPEKAGRHARRTTRAPATRGRPMDA